MDSFLKNWKAASSDNFLESIVIVTGHSLQATLSALVDACIFSEDDEMKVQRFLDLATVLKDMISIPVVFLIDQFNILRGNRNPESLESLPDDGRGRIAQYFSGWNEFKLARGAVIFAATASFASMEDARDGNASCIALLPPMNADAFRRLVETMVADGSLPDSSELNFDALFTHCGGVPRELRCVAELYRVHCSANWKSILAANSVKRYDFYCLRIERLMQSEQANEIQKGSYELACLLLLGADLKQAPRQWRDCGLIVQKELGYRLVCLAAERAVIQFFNPDKLRTALDIFSSDPFTSWRILELSFVYILRLSIYDSRPVDLRCTDLCGKNPQTIAIKISNIQHPESSPPACSVQRGTLIVFPRNQKIVDFMIHDSEGQVLFVQISESCYAEHDSKLNDEAKDSLTELAKSAVNYGKKDWKYLNVTTSRTLMLTSVWTRSASFEPSVLLLSNATGAADLFFRNISPSRSS